MKLRNKKTGEIIELLAKPSFVKRNDDYLQSEVNTFNSLDELNAEWEDYYEECEECWFIRDNSPYIGYSPCFNNAVVKYRKEIGNYFNTREEAEKAVEKLKAWKRLKDKGFKIESWSNHIGDNYYKTGQIVLNLNNVINRDWNEYKQIMEIKSDLDLLFGGQEC